MGRRRKKNRWLARRDGVDYGPYDDDELKECIARREIDLSSEIMKVASGEWSTVGEHSAFRDWYSGLHERWAREELEASVEAQERKMAAMDKVKSGTWKLVVVGVLLVAGLGSWVVYRILHAEPTGIMKAISVEQIALLPEASAPVQTETEVAAVEPVKVKRLAERETYNTGGVGVEGSGRGPSTSFDFDPDDKGGAGPGLSQSKINAITRRVSPKLVSCAMRTRSKGKAFSKARVSFLVRSGRLGGITISKKALKNRAFVSCVRGVLRKQSVPKFSGSERRVTIPIRFK